MKKKLLGCLLLTALFLVGCGVNEEAPAYEKTALSTTSVTPGSDEGNIIPGQYIVEINPAFIQSAKAQLGQAEFSSREAKAEKMLSLMAEIEKDLDLWLSRYDLGQDEVMIKYTAAIVGAALKISDDKYEQIRQDKDVISIEHDRIEKLPNVIVESIDREGQSRAQTTPCGITNAGGFANAGTSRWIWIIDSGIDLDHPDLNVVTNGTYARSFVGGSANDCNGHGTHVAGTAGARNNSIGVVGVAAGAPVVPVRVFGCSGGSATSTIVNGINHVAVYDLAGDVANLSLGGYYGSNCANNSSYKSSIQALGNSGTRVAIASGNSLSNAAFYQPACVNGTRIYTVTNMRCNKTYYNASTGGNFGRPPVDYIATGTSVYSTYLNGGYATLTGTSMASPHVAGIMQIRNAAPRSVGTVSYSGTSYPIAKR